VKKIQTKKQTIWYDESTLSDSPELCCDPEYWQQQNKIIGSAEGRGTTWFVALDNIDAALRHYRRGGLFGIKRTFCYQADLLSQKIPNAQDLVAILQEKPLSKDMYQKIGNEIRKMHAAQVNHTDLNIHNILIDNKDKVWIIDFDKCYQQDGSDWKQGNWDRLKRSFVKEVNKRNIHWNEKEWLHL
jgi:3-deoxy-D-manno-octulosonic acid kinase